MAILLPAAGASSRMRGRDKLLEPVDGIPLLRRQSLRAQATNAQVFVTLTDVNSARTLAIKDLKVQIIMVPDASDGMSASLRHGVTALPDSCTGVLVVLPDMPDLTTADFRQFIVAHSGAPNAILRGATSAGKPGHPVLLPKSVFSEVATLTGDQGAKPILKRHARQVRLVPLAQDRAILDLDTPEDWQNWRVKQS